MKQVKSDTFQEEDDQQSEEEKQAATTILVPVELEVISELNTQYNQLFMKHQMMMTKTMNNGKMNT